MDHVETTSLEDDGEEFPQQLLWLYEFKRALRENSKILLLQRGQLHTEQDIIEVLYCATKKGCCPYCGYGSNTIYVARSKGNIVFLIRVWGGCLTYDPSVDVDSFSGMEWLEAWLQKRDVKGYKDVLNTLFSKGG